MSEKLATLSFTDGTPSVDFPIYSGSIGPDVVDVRAMYAKTGKFTYDPGFMSTASCRSNITYIDGDKGVLLYRGYPIEQLAESMRFSGGRVFDPQRRAAQPGAEETSSTPP